jgi:ABC-type multidrug transport system permease subunit
VSHSSFWSVTRFVAWRNLRLLFRTPSILVPTVLFPLFFLIAFAGALSSLTKVEGFGDSDYTAFQYVFALLQSTGFAGAMGGFAMADDFENGFMRRLMLAGPYRLAIIVGFVLAMLMRAVLATLVLTGMAFILGMKVEGNAIEVLGLFAIAFLLNIAATLWATGAAMRIRSFKAAPVMVMPVFVLLFLAPVFVPLDLLTGWLHAVAVANPFTRLLEAGRGLIAGTPTDVWLAFAIVIGGTVLCLLWAVLGVRKAEAEGV